MNLDLGVRAAKLLSELEGWFLSDAITPPRYVQVQIERLARAIEANKASGAGDE